MDIYKKASERIKPPDKSVALPYPFGLSSHIFYQKTKIRNQPKPIPLKTDWFL